MLVLIRAVDKELKNAYGSPRMVRELRDWGFPASKERVERLMREDGIWARHMRCFKARTNAKHTLPVAPNLLDRDFTPAAPNQAWSADLTCLWTGEGRHPQLTSRRPSSLTIPLAQLERSAATSCKS